MSTDPVRAITLAIIEIAEVDQDLRITNPEAIAAAILAIARPRVIDQCANIAEFHTNGRGLTEVMRGDDETALEIATRIRALKGNAP